VPFSKQETEGLPGGCLVRIEKAAGLYDESRCLSTIIFCKAIWIFAKVLASWSIANFLAFHEQVLVDVNRSERLYSNQRHLVMRPATQSPHPAKFPTLSSIVQNVRKVCLSLCL
jgi:hypothetical protein